MAIEVYKLEVGANLGYFVRDWTFYLQVGNQSGRTGPEICGDLAQNLGVDTFWFQTLRFLWGAEQRCRLFRIRKVWPNIESWEDYYWRFRHYTGKDDHSIGPYNIRCRVQWYTDRWEVRSPCTYFDVLSNYPIVDNQFSGFQLLQVEAWASQHDSIRTTVHGDQFRPCIHDKYGNYSTIIGHAVDHRPVASRRDLWKG